MNPTTTILRNPSYAGRASPVITWSKTALIFVAIGLAAGQQIQSCKDGQCTECDVGNSPDPLGPSEWGVQEGYPDCAVYTGASFQGAELETGGGCKFIVKLSMCSTHLLTVIDEVWWNIGQPNPTCQIIVMSPVTSDTSGDNCGDVVVAAKNAGCYPSIIQSTFMIQYCCGSGDCSAAGIASVKRGLGDDTVAWPIVSASLST